MDQSEFILLACGNSALTPFFCTVTCTDLPVHELRAKMSGILAARHFPGLVQTGDCAAVLAVLGR